MSDRLFNMFMRGFMVGVLLTVFMSIAVESCSAEPPPCIKEQVEVLNECLNGSMVKDGYVISCINDFRFDLQSECKLNPQASSLIADKILNQLIEPTEI